MGDHDEVVPDFLNPNKREKYDLNSRIMVTAIITLSLVVVLVVILHLYARCLVRRQVRRRASITRINLAVNIPDAPRNGLDPMVIAALPIFPFKKIGTMDETCQPECSVCLSMLENDELARILPNCKHIFHAECIDKWLGSNSTCPICRSQVELRPVVESAAADQPSTPPVECVNSTLVSMEGSSSENGNQNQRKISSGSNSRLASFRRMLSRERSLHRVQDCGEDSTLEDLERQ